MAPLSSTPNESLAMGLNSVNRKPNLTFSIIDITSRDRTMYMHELRKYMQIAEPQDQLFQCKWFKAEVS